jgi:membrane-associated phospholipid phosphatase
VSGGLSGSARSRTGAWLRTLTPRGWRHLVLQVGLLGSFELVYALSGIYGRRAEPTALANARGLLDLEPALHVDWEHGIQDWALRAPHVFLDVANRAYFSSQFTVSTLFLLWVYSRRHAHFARVRNALLAANYVSVVVMFVYPLAPPRVVPGAGFIDTLNANAVNLNSSVISVLNNPNSAMPSLHASYALVLGVAGVLLSRTLVMRIVWALYPLLVFYSVIATGNHYVLDVVGGAAALAATPLVDKAAAWLATRQAWSKRWVSVERETA